MKNRTDEWEIFDFTDAEAKIVHTLNEQGSLTVSSLARKANLPRSTVDSALKRLKERNLIRKVPTSYYSVWKIVRSELLKKEISEARIEVKKGVWRKVKGNYPKDELVTSHICRRSFATNHYGKLSTPVIMSITGHKTETEFLKYIGKTPKDNAEVLNKYWKDQELKQSKKTKMKVVNTVTIE